MYCDLLCKMDQQFLCYSMPKKCCSFMHSDLLCEMGQGFLSKQYNNLCVTVYHFFCPFRYVNRYIEIDKTSWTYSSHLGQ